MSKRAKLSHAKGLLPFNLRLPEDLKLELEREATIASRSLNSEIINRLRRSLEPRYRKF